MLLKSLILGGLAAATIATSGAKAAVIDLDTLSGWDIQDQEGVMGNFFNNTYTTTVGTQVKVTDLFTWGDEYQYYIDGTPIASILAPLPPAAFQADPDAAYDSGLFAHATFFLGAGKVLSFQSLTVPFGFTDGTIAVEAGAGTGTATIPEPTSWALFIAGFGLVGTAVRRRRSVVTA